MRWAQHKDGDARIKRRFLLFPKWVPDEWRWFEVASWEERFVVNHPTLSCFWKPVKWLADSATKEQKP